MYCKILHEQKILDVIFQPKFVIRNSVGIFEEIDFANARGICSSDGTQVWNLEGRKPLLKNSKTVSVVEILRDEYEVLLETIKNKPINQVSDEEPSATTHYVTGDQLSLDTVRKYKINLMSEECTKAITNGVYVVLSDEKPHHFELQIEDQVNIFLLQNILAKGAEEVLYHEKEKPCKFYSKEDMQVLFDEASKHIVYHTTYFNSLKNYINSTNNLGAISAIYYGIEIPEEYQTEAFKSLLK